MNFARERDGTFEKHRNEQTLRLAKHVAQRQQIQNTHRLKWTRPFPVLFNFLLKRPQVRADVSMAMHDAFGLACGSRRINDFNDVVRRHLARRELRHWWQRSD